MSYIKDYYAAIKSGEITAGYWIKKAIKKLIDEMDDERFIFDTTESDKRIAFMQSKCLQSKAPYYMKPLVLLLWQKAFIEAVYSFKMASTGLRRFTEVLLEVARKNGKSTLFAADCTYDLFCGPGGADICCASNDDEQARLIWSEAAGMRERLDPRRRISTQTLTRIKNTKRNITVFRLSSMTRNKDGRNSTKVYLDESHDIDEPNGVSEIADACWRSMSSQEEPLFLNCTTQGTNRGCYLDKKIEDAKKNISGEIEDINFLAFLYEQDSEEEIWRDERTWEKSNPSLPAGVKKIDKLRRDVENARRQKALRLLMLTKDFNIPQTDAQAWLALEDYDYSCPVDPEELAGAIILGGVDLSETTDLTSAKALIMRPGDKHKYILQHYWIPESKLEKEDDAAAGAQYADWARAGLMTITEGNENNPADVADWFFSLYTKYKLRPLVIGYDQRFAKAFLDRCGEYGFDTEMIHQGRPLSNAMKLVEADFQSRLIFYGDNPVDKWCYKNCCCNVDGVGAIQPVKAKGQPRKRIDGAVSLIIAYETLRRYRGEYMTAIGGD